MGYFAHDAIVVTDFDETRLQSSHEAARRIFGDQASDLTPETTNGHRSFFIAPDGSKEGWAASHQGDRRRKQLLAELERIGADYVAVCFGGDFGIEFGAEIKAPTTNSERE